MVHRIYAELTVMRLNWRLMNSVLFSGPGKACCLIAYEGTARPESTTPDVVNDSVLPFVCNRV
jgi:hypothetical protein